MQYFKKEEMIRCYRERKCDRCAECKLTQAAMRLPNGIEENIEALVEQVLDPARRKLGKAIVVNSGFRCPLHNGHVGGASGSQHMKGEAADIAPAKDSGVTVKDLALVIITNGQWDQLILNPTFVHVSWKRNGGNRKEILKKTANGYEKVSAFKL